MKMGRKMPASFKLKFMRSASEKPKGNISVVGSVYDYKFNLLNAQKTVIENLNFTANSDDENVISSILKIEDIRSRILDSKYSTLFSRANDAINEIQSMFKVSQPKCIKNMLSLLIVPISHIICILKSLFLEMEPHKQETQENFCKSENHKTVKCRICEKDILVELYQEHSKQCLEAFKSTTTSAAIDEEIKRVVQLFSNQINTSWPASPDKSLSIMVPIHAIVLLNRLSDTEQEYTQYEQMCLSIIDIFYTMEKLVVSIDISNAIKKAISVTKKKKNAQMTTYALLQLAQKAAVHNELPLSPSNSFAGRFDDISKFEFIDFIGSGMSANVFLCKRKKTEDNFAIKVIKKSFLDNSQNKYNVLKEKNLLFSINSEHVVRTYSSFLGERNLYIVMDYYSGGNLSERLSEVGSFPESTAKACAAQIVLMLQDMRSQGIVHRDMKPQNILIDDRGMLKLIDFGLSEGRINQLQMDDIHAFGTAGYMPPEAYYAHNIKYSGDYWALGCMIYEFMYGCPPFNRSTSEKTKLATISKDVKFIDDEYLQWPEDAKDIITKLLIKNPEERLGAKSLDEIKNHPWFSDINWDKVPMVSEIDSVKIIGGQPFDLGCPQYADIRFDIRAAEKNDPLKKSDENLYRHLTGEDDYDDEMSGFVEVSSEAVERLNFNVAKKVGIEQKDESKLDIKTARDVKFDNIKRNIPPRSKTPFSPLIISPKD